MGLTVADPGILTGDEGDRGTASGGELVHTLPEQHTLNGRGSGEEREEVSVVMDLVVTDNGDSIGDQAGVAGNHGVVSNNSGGLVQLVSL